MRVEGVMKRAIFIFYFNTVLCTICYNKIIKKFKSKCEPDKIINLL